MKKKASFSYQNFKISTKKPKPKLRNKLVNNPSTIIYFLGATYFV